MKENYELRKSARELLRGNWLIPILVCVISGLFTSAGSAMGGVVPFAGFFASMLFVGPINLGVAGFFLKMHRGEETRIETIFEGFSNFISAFLVALVSWIFILLWTLLFIIPGIVAMLRYSQAVYILYDNPQMGAMEAIQRSKEMMLGYKGKLFMLYLSFIGWGLLCIITLGIGILWLAPYMSTTLAAFYEELKSEHEKKAAVVQPI